MLGFQQLDRAERYAADVDKRGGAARVSRAITGELLLKTGKRVPIVLAPVAIGGTSVPVAPPGPPPYTPNPVTDFAASWISTDGVIRLAGFIRFEGALPGGGNLTQVLTTGNDAGGLAIVDMADPATTQGAATKHYVDTASPVVKIYDYTVTGADKTSIDTGVDTPDSGTNVWSGSLLEMSLYSRTDDAAELSQINFTFNNDAGGNYDVIRLLGNAGAATSASSLGRANFFGDTLGASAAANAFGSMRLAMPNFSGTVGNKVGDFAHSAPSQVAGGGEIALWSVGYRSTAAITRLAAIPNTAGKKFKVGTRLQIFGRR
jgi:hypothetical protein